MPSVYGLVATSVLLNTLPERLLALLSTVPTFEAGPHGVMLMESEELMLKEYTQGFIVPQAFTSEYRGEYGEPRKFDAVVTRDGVILEMIGVNMPYEVMMTLDCQDITAFVEFMSEAMPTDFLSELKGLIDAELTKRRALETENEDT